MLRNGVYELRAEEEIADQRVLRAEVAGLLRMEAVRLKRVTDDEVEEEEEDESVEKGEDEGEEGQRIARGAEVATAASTTDDDGRRG